MAIAVTACSDESKTEQFVKAPEITALQESNQFTKTELDVDAGGIGTIYWKPADAINVFYGTTSTKYTSKNTDNVTVASFSTTDIIGSTEEASTNIWGLYPYNESAACNGSKVTTTIPATQYGVPETFDDDLFPTLAHSTTRELTFYNVCGGIKFSLSRNDIKRITFKGNNNESLVGTIDLTFNAGVPDATVVNGASTITLTPKTGTTFEKNVNYYIVALPVSMTGGFTMTFETETQIGTFEYTTKSVSIVRSKFSTKSNIDTYATFVDKPAAATDLSSAETANCYIVSSAGTYKFKTVQGNSSTSVGDVKGVKVLWESFGTDVTPSIGDLINADVSYADNYITFSTNYTYKEGNTVIAAYSDAACTEGNVLWSWHIWLTDQPEEQSYNNSAGYMMDRNLGATSATPGDIHSLGLLYQWGRKDPFLNSSNINPSANFNQEKAKSTYSWPASELRDNHLDNNTTLAFSISNPSVFLYYNIDGDGVNDWYCYSYENQNNQLWSSQKTKYDPCPPGWKVPEGENDNIMALNNYGIWYLALGSGSSEWTKIDINTSTPKTNRGYNFGTNNLLGKSSTIWYPLSGSLNSTHYEKGKGELQCVGDYGYYWSTGSLSFYQIYCSSNFEFHYDDQYNALYYRVNYNYRSNGCSIRCQKIE